MKHPQTPLLGKSVIELPQPNTARRTEKPSKRKNGAVDQGLSSVV